MSNTDVAQALRAAVEEYKKLGYEEIKKWAESKKVECIELKGLSGATYQAELSAFWDDKKRGTIRFLGSIEPERATWRNLFKSSINYDFIIAPDNSFVGE